MYDIKASKPFLDLIKNDKNYDISLSGKRIKLINSKDPYTELKKGDLGIIEYITLNHGFIEDQISIKWDNGSNLMLLRGIDDYEIIKQK
jgi:hypothetical protein